MTSTTADDDQIAFDIRHVRLGIWLSAAGLLLAGLRLAASGLRAPAVPFVAAGLLIPTAQLLPWRRLMRQPHATGCWYLGTVAHWLLLAGYSLFAPYSTTSYPAVSAILIVYAASVFNVRAVLGLGGLSVAGSLALSLRGADTDIPLTAVVAVVLGAMTVVCAVTGNNRRRQAESRRRAERRAEALLEQSSDALLAVDLEGTIRYQSPSTNTVLGYRAGQLVGTGFHALVHTGDRSTAARWMAGLVTGPVGTASREELRLRRADEDWCHAEILGTNRLSDPSLDALVLNIHDASTRKILEAQLTQQAFRDALTGLPNRSLFRDRVTHAVARSRRTGGSVALLLIDLDNFKLTNDSLGHACGDDLLVAVAERLTGYVRPSDTVARLGGDEFALLIEDRMDEIAAVALGERILDAIRGPVRIRNREITCTASIGVALTKIDESHPIDAEELLRDADLAMYAAKTSGRDRCVLFDPAMHVEVLREAEQRADLENAFAQDQFIVHYQPIIDLLAHRLTGVEALVRWQHPERGLLPPGAFISLAESTGLIVPLGRWVMQQACAQAVRWQQSVPNARTLRVNVNLSPRQFQYSALVTDVAGVLEHTGISPDQVVLEITESLLMTDTDQTVSTLKDLKGLGVRLAIDDFGTGYSSLSYLKRFPVDILKIDRSFVEDIADEGGQATLAEAVVQLGRALRLQTVAEGIETEDQSSRLKTLGCRYGQGYLFARPASPDEIEPLLADLA